MDEPGQQLTDCARDKPFQHPSPGYITWLTMVFTTYLFVFYFLPLILVFYYALDGLSRWAGASVRVMAFRLRPGRGLFAFQDLPGDDCP